MKDERKKEEKFWSRSSLLIFSSSLYQRHQHFPFTPSSCPLHLHPHPISGVSFSASCPSEEKKLWDSCCSIQRRGGIKWSHFFPSLSMILVSVSAKVILLLLCKMFPFPPFFVLSISFHSILCEEAYFLFFLQSTSSLLFYESLQFVVSFRSFIHVHGMREWNGWNLLIFFIYFFDIRAISDGIFM